LSILLLVAASPAHAAPPDSRAVNSGVPDKELVIGQSASFSGSFASQAASYRNGALAYFAAVNERGGVHGRRIRLVSLDDGYVVDRALENTRQLIEREHVLALFNYMWTNTVRASIPLAEAAGVPMFAPYTGYEALYARHSPQVFTTRASFADELGQIVQHLHTIGLARIGLVYYDSASGRELLAETRRRANALNLKLNGLGAMKAGSRDPAGAVQALRGADMQALILGVSGSDAVAFIRAYEPVRNGRTYYARSLIGVKQLVDELGTQAEGLSVSQTAPNPYKSRSAVSVEYRRLLERFDPQLEPDYIGLEGMIAAKVFTEALRRAGPNPTRDLLRHHLEGMNRFDVGGYAVSFAPQRHHGSRYVDITMIGPGGRIVD
jgi:ABC-type branched-subunit amino acid transport system substrate-binding protein